MSHVLKILLRIIDTRKSRKCECQISIRPFSFRKGLDIREALYSLKVLTQSSRDLNVDICACFIEYRKEFNYVNHQKMITILKPTRIDNSDRHIIEKLYYNQLAELRTAQRTTSNI